MKKPLAKVHHYDLYGKRQEKYDFLMENTIDSVNWNELENREPEYFFVPKDYELLQKYEIGFRVDKIFAHLNAGLTTARDDLTIKFSMEEFEEFEYNFINKEIEEIRQIYHLPADSRDWTIEEAKLDISKQEHSFEKIIYRPFDIKYICYSKYSKGILSYPRHEIMKHFINKENIGLIINRQSQSINAVGNSYYITNLLTDCHVIDNKAYVCPLYLYPEESEQQSIGENQTRKPNLNMEIVGKIGEKIGLRFVPEKGTSIVEFAPIDILDYIYAVLHSPSYREKYKEFLKIDFPRVPYPGDAASFWQLVNLGSELRQIHLLESPKVEEYITSYPIDGDNKITRSIGKKDWEITDTANGLGRIWLNDEQYFENIPLVAWEFYIGGYQPAQKWLKDRKGRELSFEDIMHYQKIIVALNETARLMGEIDKIGVME